MSQWDAARRALDSARETEEGYLQSVYLPHHHAAESGDLAVPAVIDAVLDRLTDVRCAAEDELIAVPAPDLPAAIWKIEYARQRWEEFEDWPADWWDRVMGDLLRFAA